MLRLGALTALFIPLFLPILAQAGDDVAYFEKNIRPLLVERCYQCHSEGHKIKGGLHLDSKDGWAKGGDSGPALVPGKPEDSLIMKAVGYHDRDLKMPPKQKLSDAQVGVLRQWIEMGAPDPRQAAVATTGSGPSSMESRKKWWSFQPLKRTPVPAVKNEAWPVNPIDRFVLAQQEHLGLHPSPAAQTETLCRRVYFDLVGLAPTVEQLDAFSARAAKGLELATADLTQHLMLSPQFGERWGRHWLDIVRFAESSGGGRTLPFKDAWRYRDYVIDSMNANTPLDQFITEQLAGDLLPYKTAAMRRKNLVATGLLVLGPTNYEEQDKQALRMDIVDEQLDTMGKAFLGMTIGCARCHDHKFDPIPQRDYYALAGIFRSTRVIRDYKDNVAHWIDTPLPMEGDVETKLEAKEAKLTVLTKELADAKLAYKKAGVASALDQLEPGAIAPSALPGIVVDDADAKLIGAWKHSKVFKTFIGEGYLTDDNKNKGAMTITFTPKITQSGRYEVRFAYTASSNRATNVPVVVFHADGEHSVKVDESEPPPIDGRFVSLGVYRFDAGGEGYVLISNAETEGFVTADAIQLLPVPENAEVAAAPSKVPDVVSPTPAKTTKGKTKGNSRISAKVKELETQIKELNASSPKRPEAMTVRDDDKIEDCPIHIRGQTRNLGAIVPRGFLSAVAVHSPLPPTGESGRIELARWITSKDNPLASRVLANRVWSWLMGEGLVRSVDNFGTTGETPTNPELLDYLANELVSSGWDLRHLIALIVSSRTYQQASTPTLATAALEKLGQRIDPENLAYWHANRRRLDAECLRDLLLQVGGNMDAKVGGPNILRADAVDVNSSSAQTLEYNYRFTDTRRSVYTPAFRNKRQELFEAFDFADINQSQGKRNTSTVAPQALYMLNHPFVMEQSRNTAELILAAPGDDVQHINLLYRRVLGRLPTARELQLCRDFVQSTPGDAESAQESWPLLVQALFASADFRYVD